MADDVIWQLIKNGFCSFRKTTDTKSFCTNIYNVTGLCNHASCPLANSNYATVIEDQGDLLLCIKRIEKAHLPREMWKKIKLSTNKREAMNQINDELKFGISTHLTTKCKLRYNRLKEVLNNIKNIFLKTKHKLTPVKKKIIKRESVREKKALIAAKLDRSIENELLNRLNQGIYGELYMFSKSDSKDTLVDDKLKESEKEAIHEPETIADRLTRRKRKNINIEYEQDDNYQLQLN